MLSPKGDESMHRIYTGMLALLLACCTFAAKGEEAWYLRVIGRDDTPAAQAEKLRVRDEVLSLCPRQASQLEESLPAIRQAAERTAPCRVEVRLWRPHAGVPAAPTVYITIGEGRGRNWWGVLYEDALLLARAEEETAEEAEEGTVTFVWPWWAWVCRLFGGG